MALDTAATACAFSLIICYSVRLHHSAAVVLVVCHMPYLNIGVGFNSSATARVNLDSEIEKMCEAKSMDGRTAVQVQDS